MECLFLLVFLFLPSKVEEEKAVAVLPLDAVVKDPLRWVRRRTLGVEGREEWEGMSSPAFHSFSSISVTSSPSSLDVNDGTLLSFSSSPPRPILNPNPDTTPDVDEDEADVVAEDEVEEDELHFPPVEVEAAVDEAGEEVMVGGEDGEEEDEDSFVCNPLVLRR